MKSNMGSLKAELSRLCVVYAFLGIALFWSLALVGRIMPCATNGSTHHFPPLDLPWEVRPEKSLKSHVFTESLAYQQSFGFFDDRTDQEWNLSQSIHESIFPNHYGDNVWNYSIPPNKRNDRASIRRSNFWYGDNFHVEFVCAFAQRVPPTGQADGPKWVCDPHRFRKTFNDHLKREKCLIYSFGSNGKAEFENGMYDLVGDACEIHTFDMHIYNVRNGYYPDALPPTGTFHQWGWASEDLALESQEAHRVYEQARAAKSLNETIKKGLLYRTLQQTMQELGHVNRTIDILKFDCEWCEWSVYDQILKADVRQLLVETHNAPMPEAQAFFMDLHDAGFLIFSKEANYQNNAGAVEYGLLKLSTDFLRGNFYRNRIYPDQG